MKILIPTYAQHRIVGLLVGAILVVRLFIHFALYHAGFISLTADEFGRTIVAAEWVKHPTWEWKGAWLPFHRPLIGLFLKLHWELLWTPRIVTIIFGLLSIVFMFLLTKKLFDSYVVGLISAGLLSVNPLHVWLSSVPLTEMVSLTLVLIGVWAFVGYMIDAKAKYLLVAGIMLGFASGFRIESWFFSAILSLFLLINNIVIGKFTNRYVFLFMSSSWFFFHLRGLLEIT